MREFRHVLRRLRGSPAFTIAATLTLAIAIGATASVFGVVDGVLLKAFPYRDPARVLEFIGTNPTKGIPSTTLTPADFLDYRAQATSFTSVAAARYAFATVTGNGEAERLEARNVTPNYFPTVGLTPVLGRFLAPDSGGPAEAVIGYGYWQRRLGGEATAIGRTLILDGQPHTIVGVAPAGLAGDVEVWTRLSFSGAEAAARNRAELNVYGRLKPGVTPEQAQQELRVIAARLALAYPATNEGATIKTEPLLDTLVGEVRPALITLLAAAGCVLLIGAANLANLFLVRYLARERELAVRAALGATRGRLIRELTLEALTLGVAGCALGVGLAVAGAAALRQLAPPTLPRLNQVGVDGRVLAFCALATMAAVIVFGLLPAWRASRGNVAETVKEAGRGTASARRHRLQSALVVLQVSVALVLLTGAGLFVESFARFRRIDPGFKPDGVLTAQITPPPGRYAQKDEHARFLNSVVEHLSAVPGVRSASVSLNVPAGPYQIATGFAIIGDPAADAAHSPLADLMCVSPEYFRTMGMRLQRGRGVLPTDDSRSPGIVVIDNVLARRYFGTRDPIGRRLDTGDTVTIVGVVSGVRHHGLAADEIPVLYAPFAQCPAPFAFLEVRTAGDPAALANAVKHAMSLVDPNVPVSDVKTMSVRVAQSVGTTNFSTFLVSLFALVAFVLGVIGIYSVLAYTVAQRRREIGIRIALGATGGHVVGDVVRRALVLTGVGVALGSGVAWCMTRALSGLFLGVSPHDPAIFIGAPLVFAAAALVAASVPAVRSTRVDPVVVLT
jgi:putative ABC transport system permease protein